MSPREEEEGGEGERSGEEGRGGERRVEVERHTRGGTMKGVKGHIMTTCLSSCCHSLHVSPAAVTHGMSHQLLLHIACLTSCCHTSHFSPAAPWALLCLQTQATARPAAEREPSSWQGRTHQNTGQSRSGHDTQCITAWKELRNMMHNRILQGQGPTTIVFRRRGVTCQAG